MPISSETDKPANAEETEMNTLNSFFFNSSIIFNSKKNYYSIINMLLFIIIISMVHGWFFDEYALSQ